MVSATASAEINDNGEITKITIINYGAGYIVQPIIEIKGGGIALATRDTTLANVENMSGMFKGANAFNKDISWWNTSNVTDMSDMFNGEFFDNGWQYESAFNNGGYYISDLNVANVTNMNSMFKGAKDFNGDISAWNVSAVKDMKDMFYKALTFNQDISSWIVSSVTDMSGMFKGASIFDKDIGDWERETGKPLPSDASTNATTTSTLVNVTDMSSMFYNATTFNKNLNSWNVLRVKDMHSMFYNAGKFNQDIKDWNVSKVTDMSNMFQAATIFNQDISSWNSKFLNAPNTTNMFLNSGMNFGDKFQYPFKDTSQLKTAVDDWILDQSHDQTQSTLTYGDINTWYVSFIKDMSELFKNGRLKQGESSGGETIDTTTFNSDISGWDVSKVTNMRGMFQVLLYLIKI